MSRGWKNVKSRWINWSDIIEQKSFFVFHFFPFALQRKFYNKQEHRVHYYKNYVAINRLELIFFSSSLLCHKTKARGIIIKQELNPIVKRYLVTIPRTNSILLISCLSFSRCIFVARPIIIHPSRLCVFRDSVNVTISDSANWGAKQNAIW